MSNETVLFDCSRIAGGLVELVRAKKSNRLLVTGEATAEMLAELRQRGFGNVTSTKTSGLPRGQFDMALIVWQDHSIRALETTLDWLVHFLCRTGVLGIWVGSAERGAQEKIKLALDRLGFRIQAGGRVEHGIALCARRFEIVQVAMAA